jgi:hypothetical protein
VEDKIIGILDRLLKHDINKNEATTRLLSLYSFMPPLSSFKERRERLKLSLRSISAVTGISISTISRAERGYNCDYGNIKALNDWYCSRGV